MSDSDDEPRRSAAGAARRTRAESSTVDDRGAVRFLRERVLSRLTTRRAALLAMVVCALALSIAVPLRTYQSPRAEYQAELRQQQALRQQEAELTQAQQQLSDNAQVEAEARTRFGYVMPGETPYVVQLPGGLPATGTPSSGQPTQPEASWYGQLWNSVLGNH
jgi:cell division protein FtsB